MEKELETHRTILELLLENRIPKKEININLWASVAATKLAISQDAAYKRVKSAGRALDAAGVGRYIEGRRGRESRFRANVNMKEYVQSIVDKAEVKMPATKKLMDSAEPVSSDQLEQLVAKVLEKRLSELAKPTIDILKEFSAEELLAAAQAKLNSSKK